MKILSMFFVVLMVCLMAGCGDDDEDELNGAGGEYAGFSTMKAGSWSEYTFPEGERSRWEYLGTDTYDGRECFLMELETSFDGEMIINQIWIDKTTGDAVLFVMKQNEMVMKLNISSVPETPGGAEGTPQQAQQIGVETYTTPTNKTVEATIYRVDNTDEWVSGEVPFGVVKSVENGELVMELYDFEFSGAKRDISKEEAENAQSIGFPDIPGDIPDVPDNPDIPDVPDDPVPQGQIVITVGPSPRPEIRVSEPIRTFMMSQKQGWPVWWFACANNQSPSLPGPFRYGVLPANAKRIAGPENPPDLIAGQTYTINVIGEAERFIPRMGRLEFTR